MWLVDLLQQLLYLLSAVGKDPILGLFSNNQNGADGAALAWMLVLLTIRVALPR